MSSRHVKRKCYSETNPMILIIFFFILSATILDFVLGSVTVSSEERLFAHLAYFCALALMCVELFVLFTQGKIVFSNFVKALFAWLLLVSAAFVLSQGKSFQTILDYFKHIYWGISGIYAYQMVFRGKLSKKTVVTFFLFVTLILACRSLLLVYSHGLEVINMSWTEQQDDDIKNMLSELMNKNSFMMIWMFPLIFYDDSKRGIHYIVIGSVFLCTFFSMKFGVFAALLAALIALFFYQSLVLKTIAKKTATSFIMVFFLVFGGLICTWDSLSTRLESKLDRGQLDSGRSDHWQIILTQFWEAPMENKILGHGFYQVAPTLEKMYGARFFAHSDWIETLYDFGIIGILLLINLHMSIFLKLCFAIRIRHKMTKPLILTFCFLFFPSFVTMTIIGVPLFTLYFTFGVILAEIDRYPHPLLRQNQ